MSENSKTPPYQSLGNHLLQLRQNRRESVAEVSGAIEIDVAALERIEQGTELPSEDILLLLISHFGIRDDEAVHLWELAGYDNYDDRGSEPPHLSKQPVLMVLGLDARVVYTNGISVSADPSGVVMNFTQYVEPTLAPVPVARLGMSHEQAQKVLEVLEQALLRDKYTRGPKSLPAPNQPAKNTNHLKKKSEKE